MMEAKETKRKNTILWVLFALLAVLAVVVSLINTCIVQAEFCRQ